MSEKPLEAFDHRMFSKLLQNKFWKKVYLTEKLLKICVDKLTLIRFIKQTDPSCVVGTQSTLLSTGNQILTPAMEKDLASHIVFLADMYFGLS